VIAEPLVNGKLRVKILGDGPDIQKFAAHAKQVKAPVDFLGYVYYDKMCSYLAKSDVLINSLVKGAPQSIVSKVADYLAAAKPIINTGESPEFKEKVESDCFGINVEPQNSEDLAAAIIALSQDREALDKMGRNGRRIAEEQFDRPHAYKKIVELVDRITGKEQ
jgi:glycosyltransferase involved in cell wall biosynthesis